MHIFSKRTDKGNVEQTTVGVVVYPNDVSRVQKPKNRNRN